MGERPQREPEHVEPLGRPVDAYGAAALCPGVLLSWECVCVVRRQIVQCRCLGSAGGWVEFFFFPDFCTRLIQRVAHADWIGPTASTQAVRAGQISAGFLDGIDMAELTERQKIASGGFGRVERAK